MASFKIQIKNGKFINKDFIIDNLANLDDGFYNLFVEKSEVGQAKYFFNRDVIAEHLGYGTAKEKKELHELIKMELLPEVFKNPENLNTEDYENLSYSSKFLSPFGWFNLNRSLSIYAMSKFEVRLDG